MIKCPICKERPANFAFRKGDSFVNWCYDCMVKDGVLKLKAGEEPAQAKMMTVKINDTWEEKFHKDEVKCHM